ncbi:DNA alkylation repair protein [Litoribacillus peritrichatus]|uniref:DNA alkylation repair protein n=1 Tax=Litoribacillus peritrichatus TaxID=718191 RepID=A0ABP7N9M3_9GAMM
MAEPLKHRFGPEIPEKISAMIVEVYPEFTVNDFLEFCLSDYQALELKARALRIAQGFKATLPDSYPEAIKILVHSLGEKLTKTDDFGMSPFVYFPHVLFVSEYGLEHFEESMAAQYELTQRFSAEFSIRAFIEKYPEDTMARLAEWALDPDVHIRRLASEGTRPRLPWAQRLPIFQKDPQPVLKILELLKDDPELFVRRSVANNLNDIGKDNPQVLVDVAERWMVGASAERQWIVRHALRSAVKRAEPKALAILGYQPSENLEVVSVKITPTKVNKGESVTVCFTLKNNGSLQQSVMADFSIHFVKANGKTSPKVFKMKSLQLGPNEQVTLSKKVSLAEMTTRKHYPGVHKVDVILNGVTHPLGQFELMALEAIEESLS